jgi:hypothetical protein
MEPIPASDKPPRYDGASRGGSRNSGSNHTSSGEFDGSTLIEVFDRPKGIFATPTIVEASVRRWCGVAVVGRLDRIREPYAVRRSDRSHPAVIAITESARRDLLAERRGGRS